jgi:hypothetical protein
MKKNKEVKKFSLEKFEIAKLKNSHLIIGGNSDNTGPVDGTNQKDGGSSRACN